MQKIVDILFSWDRLRNAIMDEARMYDSLGRTLNNPDAMAVGAKFWCENDGWRGWSHNPDMNRYYFNDIAENGIIEAWREIDDMEGAIHIAKGDINGTT